MHRGTKLKVMLLATNLVFLVSCAPDNVDVTEYWLECLGGDIQVRLRFDVRENRVFSHGSDVVFEMQLSPTTDGIQLAYSADSPAELIIARDGSATISLPVSLELGAEIQEHKIQCKQL